MEYMNLQETVLQLTNPALVCISAAGRSCSYQQLASKIGFRRRNKVVDSVAYTIMGLLGYTQALQ